jgi:hypothetical protein
MVAAPFFLTKDGWQSLRLLRVIKAAYRNR